MMVYTLTSSSTTVGAEENVPHACWKLSDPLFSAGSLGRVSSWRIRGSKEISVDLPAR